MVELKSINYNSRYCTFSIDSASDIKKLPNLHESGKDKLVTIKTCSAGSIAHCTDGTTYILQGDTNEWILYNNGSGSSGNSSTTITRIPDEKILSLFNENDEGNK